jgi:hypothetical protein
MEENRYIIPGLERLHGLVLDLHGQSSIVCHLSRELNNSGAQFWLLDTDERAYKTDPLFRRRGTPNWRISKLVLLRKIASERDTL